MPFGNEPFDAAEAPSPAKPGILRGLLFVLCLVVILSALSAALYFRGREFYGLNVADRVDHPDFGVLSPGQSIGHGYGVAGTVLILTNLLYLARRKLAARRLGSMRAWLDIHVVTGLSGSVLVVFHSAFQFRTPIAVSTMIALGVVVTTGIIGRWIHSLTPKPDLDRMDRHLLAFDDVGPGMGQAMRRELARVPITELTRPSLPRVLATLPGWIREARQRRSAILLTGRRFEADNLAELQAMHPRIVDCANLASAEARYRAANTLMRSWRGMHRLAAILMLLFVSVHIIVAWIIGYRWIFSE